MYVHIGIIGRDKTTQLSLALFVIVSDSVTLGERAYNSLHYFLTELSFRGSTYTVPLFTIQLDT